MITFSQSSPSNDLYLDANGQLVVSTGRASYADIIADAIRTTRGELWSDTGFGVEYFGTVFARSNTITEWEQQVRMLVQSLDFVSSITSFDTEYNADTHVLTFKIVVETDDGEVTVEG